MTTAAKKGKKAKISSNGKKDAPKVEEKKAEVVESSQSTHVTTSAGDINKVYKAALEANMDAKTALNNIPKEHRDRVKAMRTRDNECVSGFSLAAWENGQDVAAIMADPNVKSIAEVVAYISIYTGVEPRQLYTCHSIYSRWPKREKFEKIASSTMVNGNTISATHIGILSTTKGKDTENLLAEIKAKALTTRELTEAKKQLTASNEGASNRRGRLPSGLEGFLTSVDTSLGKVIDLDDRLGEDLINQLNNLKKIDEEQANLLVKTRQDVHEVRKRLDRYAEILDSVVDGMEPEKREDDDADADGEEGTVNEEKVAAASEPKKSKKKAKKDKKAKPKAAKV